MSNRFFVTGLPRSRTAWLANFLTAADSFCHHDALRLGRTVDFLAAYLDETQRAEGVRHVGDSDSALCLIAQDIVNFFPDAPWVIIERPLGNSLDSYLRYFTDHPYPSIPKLTVDQARAAFNFCQRSLDAAKAIIPKESLMIVQFDDLNDIQQMRAIWEWLLPDVRFSAPRYDMLNTLAVTVISEKVRVWQDFLEVPGSWRENG